MLSELILDHPIITSLITIAMFGLGIPLVLR